MRWAGHRPQHFNPANAYSECPASSLDRTSGKHPGGGPSNQGNSLTEHLNPRGRSALQRVRRSLSHVGSDIAQGFFDVSHNGFAVLGVVVAFVVITLTARPDLREAAENQLMALLVERQEGNPAFGEPAAVNRATALNPSDLPKPQAALAHWLSRKYGVAPEPVAALVAAAHEVGKRVEIDPTLILAIMAVESGFNPFAQSPMGAQGLMQVMTSVHHQKYTPFGGKLAAFDPVTNLRVGVRVLQACIERAGSLEGGLKFYVGAANLQDDNGYVNKVLAERARLQQVIEGKTVPASGPSAFKEPVLRPASAAGSGGLETADSGAPTS